MKTAAIISRDAVLNSMSERMLSGLCQVVPFSTIESSLDYVYTIIPNLLIVDLARGDDAATIRALNNLKDDPIFTHLSVLAVMEDHIPLPDWDSLSIEDYIWKSQLQRDLRGRSALCMRRSERVVELNPLTRLPGNISINRTIQHLIDEKAVFAVGYADIDNFKPFNDYYGFTRGDEVIKMTGRLVLNIVKNRQPQDSFVGHIGGDDFLFIMSADLADETALEIVTAFDRIICTFYDGHERETGGIMSTDRQGNLKSFPLMSLSIGVCSNREHTFSHYGQFTEAVSEMKRYAKRYRGSCYRSDRRAGSAETGPRPHQVRGAKAER